MFIYTVRVAGMCMVMCKGTPKSLEAKKPRKCWASSIALLWHLGYVTYTVGSHITKKTGAYQSYYITEGNGVIT